MHKSEREQSFAKTAIDLMGELGVAPTPANFELFYTYASGENAAITRILGDMIGERRPVTPEILSDLRARCLAGTSGADMVESVGENIGATLDAILGRIQAAGKDAVDYGRALSIASGELGDEQSPAALRKLVNGLIGATRAMETRTKNLETELQRSSQQVTDLRSQLENVRKESLTDTLTGIANRKAFDNQLAAALTEAQTKGEAVSLMMCDIDRFKQFNDTWGHQTGDQVLRLVASCLSENVKGRDTAARYGGEEFAVILRHATLADAVRLADQIRQTVQSKKLVKKSTGDILGSITVSIGVAQFAVGETGETLVRRADACLYRAKNTGRNRVIGESDPLAPSEIDAA